MPLTLSMLRCPDTVAPQTRQLSGGELAIGRGTESDWTLPDPERLLSRRHCIIAYHAGSWQIADLSANGTFLNGEAAPIGQGQTRDLRHGDRLRLGPYEIDVQIAETGTLRGAPAPATNPFAANPFAVDPFAAPPARGGAGLDTDPLLQRGRGDGPFGSPLAPAAINLPADYDPLAPDPAEDRPPEDRLGGPVQPDHAPHLEDAFPAPAARAVLPEDWDREIEVRAPPPAAPAPAPPPVIAAPPVAPPAAAPPRPAPAAAEEDLLAAFLRGTGLAGLRPADPAAAMEMLGAAFRVMVGGLRQAMIARAAIKSEFRIEQTLIRTHGNNPLKFSANDADALAALLGAGRRTDMDAVAAIGDALRDMRLHELASLAAMQEAVRALLAEFDPGKLRRQAERSGFGFVPVQKKANAWDAFEALYARIVQALADDFDSVFGKAFARAYERALADAAARDAER